MGQEQSTQVDESVSPVRLKDRSLNSIAQYIRSGKAKKIVLMVGAGISTSAGIPDFRSPETGLYANLAKLDLPYAEAVFDISFFRSNPTPFYTLAHELYPGKYRPTLSHSFIRLLSKKGLLLKLFTQNIDCLDREAGVPEEKIVEAHGSFATQSCIECRTPYPENLMKQAIEAQDVPHCQVPQCNGLVKPDIVFFGEQLPENFHKNRSLPTSADLCIIMGTSLSVQPFASLPMFCEEGVPRLLINLERVGGLGSRPDDVLLLGDCDTGVRKLAESLGWLEELEALWSLTDSDTYETEPHVQQIALSADEDIEAKVAKLTAEVDQSLKISQDHGDSVKSQLTKEQTKKATKEIASSDPVETSTSVGKNKLPSTDGPRLGDYFSKAEQSGKEEMNGPLEVTAQSELEMDKDELDKDVPRSPL